MTTPSIEDSCFWMARRAPRPPQPLPGNLEADVVVVGGGLTGLWTAIFLRQLEPARRVVVVEQGRVGEGASGRNAGIAGETLDHSHERAIAHFGLEEARDLARLGRENLAEMEQFLSERGIAAGFERTGQLVMALSDAHRFALEKDREAARRCGIEDGTLLSATEARAEIDSPLYQGALRAPRHALLDPVALVEGLRREAERLGAGVYEKTEVTDLNFRGGRVTVGTNRGTVAARKGVLATNAYSHRLHPALASRFLPLYDYILVSEPLSPAQRDAIGWRSRCGVTDARNFFNYYRLTEDSRILWGTSEAVYHAGNRVDPAYDRSAPHEASLRESFRRHFPRLAGLAFPFAWGGPIASTTRLTPFFGSVAGRLAYGLGYTGHGLGSTRVAGRILAHMALERDSPLLELRMVRRKPMPYPPEPLRRLAVSAVTRSLRRVDAGGRAGLLLRLLDAFGIGFSS